MAGKAGIALVEIRFNPGDLERMMAEAKAAGKEIASDTSDEINKKGSIWKSLLSNWKLLVPAIAAGSVAVLGFTGNLGALAPLLPVLTVALTGLIAPFTTLAALAVGFIPPLTLLGGLLGGLGVAFGFAAFKALRGGGQFAGFAAQVHELGKQFSGLTTALASRFLPIFSMLAHSASDALGYLTKIAHLPLKQAFESLSTTGVTGFQKFVDKIGHLVAKPIRLAFQVAFGKSDTLRNALEDDWNDIVQFFVGHKGVLLPVRKWFGKQDFTAVGYRWANDLAGAVVAGLGLAFQKLLSSQGGRFILGGAGIGAIVGAFSPIGPLAGAAIGTGIGIGLNHYWPKITGEATKAFHKVGSLAKRALGPELWGQIISLAKSFWDTIKAIGGYIQNHVFPVVKHVFNALGGWHTVGLVIVGVVRTIVGGFVAVGRAVRIVYNAIQTVVHWVQRAANAVSGGFASAWDAVKSAVGIVSGAISTIVDNIRAAIGLAQSLASALSSGLGGSAGSGGQGGAPSTGKGHIGGHPTTATGGIVTSRQTRIVGEAGAEAIIPLTSQIGRNTLAAMGGDTTVQVFIDGKEIESAVYKVQRRTARAVQAGSRWG